MIRYKILVEYDGLRFSGWQFQNNQKTVQGTLQNILEKITGNFRLVEGCGRTDTGVHAKGQVAHFDLPNFWDFYKLREAMNAYGRFEGLSVLDVEQVPDTFHARFSCAGRSYEYVILNRQASSPILENRVWHVSRPLDVQAMQQGAHYFLGHHDFTSFRASECQASNTCKTISEFIVSQEGDLIRLSVSSRSFLHNQVRIMVGTLKQVGLGKMSPIDIDEILNAKDRKRAGPTAPPYGLYFMKAFY